MRKTMLLVAALTAPALFASHEAGPRMTVLVDGLERAEYSHRGRVYIEALRGREYTIRLSNPTPYRVAVALSVDGLNTIDAKHTDAFSAAKWVLDPYESTEISGWQVSDRSARRFFFTDEERSYGARLGQTENLGIIAAVFYRERVREYAGRYESGGGTRGKSADAQGAPPSAAAAQRESAALSEDHAATGMGGRTRHDVSRVHVDLEPEPIASMSFRYEFRPQLVKLGVLPSRPAPMDRRERAEGFAYCPE